MKRLAPGLIFSMVLLFTTASLCHAIHDIAQLTSNTYDDGYPIAGVPDGLGYELNDDGTWVWQGFDGTDWEIFLSTGKIQNPGPMTNNSVNDQKPDINNNGTVVWQRSSGANGEIILSNGVGETNLSNSATVDDSDPRIGDGGDVVWEGDDGTDLEVFLYDGLSASNISNDLFYDDEGPQVNANGNVVWTKDLSAAPLGKKEIYYYDGSTPTNITNTPTDEDKDPQINDFDEVVWAGHDGSDYEIFFWDGVSTIQVTNNSVDDSLPRINNAGEVVWFASDGTDQEVFYWDGQTPVAAHTTQLTSNSTDDSNPYINEAGEVAWRGFVSSAWQVFLWDGQFPVSAHTTQITTDTNWGKGHPKINDNSTRLENDILWKGREVAWPPVDLEIFLAISCTDADGDTYCSDAEPGGDDCDDDPTDDPTGCDACSCGESACSVCARCINPAAVEVCDGVDNNCILGIDENPAANDSCVDEFYCNGVEFCSGGACQDGPDVDCDDGVSCTVDACNEDEDTCENVATDALCDDGLWCTGIETCDPVLDCQDPPDVDCDDGVGCTVDACNEATDSCDNLPNDALCDDGLWCTGIETCDPALDCLNPPDVDCDDGVGCTDDSCNEGTDSCDYVPNNANCDDGLWCTGEETCDPALDCQEGTDVDCTDTSDCTDDSCDEEGDVCRNVCIAVDPQDACCSDPGCDGAPICGEPCIDLDGDGFGDPGSPQCTYPSRDCDDSDENINPFAEEIPGNGIDEDCDGQDGTGCFVATAAFGTPLEGKIDALRAFRDTCLMKSAAGRAFVKAYYQHGPPIARAIAEREWLRGVVRVLLLPLVGMVSLVV
jgi:hypothetical protein